VSTGDGIGGTILVGAGVAVGTGEGLGVGELQTLLL